MSTPTIADAEDSWLYASSFFEQWRQEFELKWNLPRLQRVGGVLVGSLPPEALEKVDFEKFSKMMVGQMPIEGEM